MALNKYYDVDFSINGIDLSANVTQITIYNTIRYIFPVFLISFYFDSKRFSYEEIFGQDEASLSFMLTTENENPNIEQADLNLTILKIDSPVKINLLKDLDPQREDAPAQIKINLVCIPKNCLNAMTTTVNALYSVNNKKTPLGAVQELVDTFLTGISSNIIYGGINNTLMEQLLVPPSTFIAATRYIDALYGIFNGPYLCFCRFNNNELCIWSLANRIRNNSSFTVSIVSPGYDSESITGASASENRYFTYSNIETDIRNNAKVMKGGYDHIFVRKPLDSLYELISVNMQNIYQNNSVRDINNNLQIDNIIKNRTQVHESKLGSDGGEGYYSSQLSRYISSNFSIQFNMDRNISVNQLSKVGDPITIESPIPSYINYTGKYILGSSLIVLSRRSQPNNTENFICNAKLRCFRGNASLLNT